MTDPKVSIISATGDGLTDSAASNGGKFAAALLAFTKNTRLNMNPDGFNNFKRMDEDQLMEEIQYMAHTIRSSWEFVDVIFLLSDVSRACAQQITRTRNASFAMQSQRVTDVSMAGHHIPPRVADDQSKLEFFEDSFSISMSNYKDALDIGFEIEDARGLLPINLHCNLVAKYNLRALVELLAKRSSSRVQGEYGMIVKQMKSQLISMWPWVEKFLVPQNQMAIDIISEVMAEIVDNDLKWKLAKAQDQLRGQQ